MEQENLQLDNSNQSEVSLVETFFHYFSYWKFFIISIIVCLAIIAVYLLYTTPLYRVASQIILTDNSRNQSTGIDVNTFRDLGIMTPQNNMGNEIAVLNSRSLMR